MASISPSSGQVSNSSFQSSSIKVISLEGGGGSIPDNKVLEVSNVVHFLDVSEPYVENISRARVVEQAIEESLESAEIPVTGRPIVKPETITGVFSKDRTNRPFLSSDIFANATIAQPQVEELQFIPHKVTSIPPSEKWREGETSTASKGTTVFFTGNTYAARSTDGGKKWQYLDVYKDMETCCDQDVVFDPKRNIFIWLRQEVTDHGENKDRLGISQDTFSWYMYDITPEDLNSSWERHEFDYPHLALGNNFLYITTNMYGDDISPEEGALIIRVSLNDLQNFGPARYSYYIGPPETFTFTPVQGASDKMYWATHKNNAEMRIFEWDESLPWKEIKVYDRPVPPWSQISMGAAMCGIQTSSSLNVPRSSEWCSRSDSRVQSGVIAKNLVTFFWDADARTRTERNATFPWPYINAATFNLQNEMEYQGRPYIWSPDNAWLFASSAVNEDGKVGILAYYGGINTAPSLAFGIINDPTKSASRGMVSIAKSTHFPEPRFDDDTESFLYVWGDYIRLRSHNGLSNTWDAAGFVLEGGSTRKHIQPYYFTIQSQEGIASDNQPPSEDPFFGIP